VAMGGLDHGETRAQTTVSRLAARPFSTYACLRKGRNCFGRDQPISNVERRERVRGATMWFSKKRTSSHETPRFM